MIFFFSFFVHAGRVATIEPNIQAIPKEFDIDMPSVIGESPPAGGAAPSTHSVQQGKRGRIMRTGAYTPLSVKTTASEPGPKYSVSIRNVFCPFKGTVLAYSINCFFLPFF